MQKFSGEGTPHPRPQPPRRLRRLDLRAYGAQAQRDTPEKNPSYGLEFRLRFSTYNYLYYCLCARKVMCKKPRDSIIRAISYCFH